jgi:hypothetical protein
MDMSTVVSTPGGLIPEPLPPRLPTHLELPDKDNQPVRNSVETPLGKLLCETLEPVLHKLHPEGNYFIGLDVGIYWRWQADNPISGAKSPDWYYVANVPADLNGKWRRSYVLWQERVPPALILEFASDDGTEDRDNTPNTGKFWVYEQRIRPSYYGIFDAETGLLDMFVLEKTGFVPMQPNEHGRFEIVPLGLELGIWKGSCGNGEAHWLRWWDKNGTMLPNALEREQELREQATRERREKEQARSLAEQERREKEALQQEIERLKEQLRVDAAERTDAGEKP